MSRLLVDLSPRFLPLARILLSNLVEAKIHVAIVFTGRTAAEQAEAVRTGHSRVPHSKHQDGDAIDVAPFETYELHGPDKLQWDITDPIWMQIGAVGEALGLRWGGRFTPMKKNRDGELIGWDPGHFEYVTPSPPSTRA